ncbi:lysyl oxidase family protein [Microlunatus speluncae]|uniref:lysyl oxidase family protein n=1 Tax=Microlunatus speluncae TaxID=2594267 RepID=UPI0012666568|nr:lysyl oxidase family protein [Microlunatus speluncae]
MKIQLRAAVGFAAALAMSAGVGATALPAATAGPVTPQLKLELATKNVTAENWDGDTSVDLSLYAVAGKRAFEVRAYRTSYDRPISAWQVKPGPDQAIPEALVPTFDGLKKFFTVQVVDAKGKVVVDRKLDFCPNGYEQVRRRPDAPATSPYPEGCGWNPYTTGMVWGIEKGFAVRSFDSLETKLKPGSYKVITTIAKNYRDLFELPTAAATATANLKVIKGVDEEAHARKLQTRQQQSQQQQSKAPAPVKPTGRALLGKPSGPLPDLQSLPAWGIMIDRGRYLDFSATVWNAGPSPLVVDGFRQDQNEDLMDAYQYFFNSAGKQIGHKQVGTMEWDPRDGHHHWHFTDFARYRLLDQDKNVVVRSQKEAFCLANTDAIDYTVKGANWKPGNTDLHTACGDRGSIGIREVLASGSGDTYVQYLPGQSFDLKGLKNGVYYIEVTANPDRKLVEVSTTNNITYRKVTIGGTNGHRTVKVAKVGVITEPPPDGDEH